MREAYKPVVIEGVYPELDCGRYPVKREVGDTVEVRADIFKEGHDKLQAVVKHRVKGKRRWAESPMELLNPGLDRWGGSFEVTENARYEYAVEAWFDEWETWRSETEKKVDDGQIVELELIEGREIVAKASNRSGDAGLFEALEGFDGASYEERLGLLFSKDLRELMADYPDRSSSTVYGTLEMVVDRVRARYAAWYEMFPRSQGTEPGRSATFREAEARLPEISAMGFDVVYLTPIHPIGATNRKGRNNALVAGPRTPAAPTASARRTAGTRPSTRSSGRSKTSATLSGRRRSAGWRWRSTSRSRPLRTTPGSGSTRSGSSSGPTGR
uniref:maltotransferase domain-containing protein n=1 Tax=Rubrobacter marinus TaxID=2653852 RepID=UPI001D193F6B|nr:maltotransferase domain-containing protein [Rubrobacter marinus]